MTFFLQPCPRFVAIGVEAEEVAARREEAEARRGAEAAAVARMAAEEEGLELACRRSAAGLELPWRGSGASVLGGSLSGSTT